MSRLLLPLHPAWTSTALLALSLSVSARAQGEATPPHPAPVDGAAAASPREKGASASAGETPTGAAAAAGAPFIAPTAAEVKALPDKVALGQPFELLVSIQHPEAHRYEFAPPEELGPFSLLDVARRRQDAKGQATTEFRLRLSLFELGPQEVPALTFEVMTPEGPRRFVTRPVPVEGLKLLPEDADQGGVELRGYKPPEDVPVTTWRLLWYALATLAALLLAWRLWRWWRGRPAPEVPALPLLPLDVRTRSALETLRAERLPEAGRQKEFYSRLSDILRGYVGERYRVEALECTTPELVVGLNRVGAPRPAIAQLQDLLEEADLVKFAKMQVEVTACHAALEAGHRLVQLTSMPPPPAAPPPPTPARDVPPGPQLP